MKQNLWLTMATCLAYGLDKELWKAIDYLKEQVRVLREQQEKDQRILLGNHQRMRLATKAERLTRELLQQTTVLFTPETVLGWYRKLIAQKYDGSENCQNPARPGVSQEIINLVVRFKEENPPWGYTRIRDYIVHLGCKIGETTVKNVLWEDGYATLPESADVYCAGEQFTVESPGGMTVYLQVRKPAITPGESHMGNVGSDRFDWDALSQTQLKCCVGRSRQPQ